MRTATFQRTNTISAYSLIRPLSGQIFISSSICSFLKGIRRVWQIAIKNELGPSKNLIGNATTFFVILPNWSYGFSWKRILTNALANLPIPLNAMSKEGAMEHNLVASRYGNTGKTISIKLDVNYIKKSISPFNFYRRQLPTAPLKKQIWNDGGLCPFHRDRKPGSFRVNLVTGAFICFACGSKGGDIVNFIMALHGLQFSEALNKLAIEWGLK